LTERNTVEMRFTFTRMLCCSHCGMQLRRTPTIKSGNVDWEEEKENNQHCSSYIWFQTLQPQKLTYS